MDLSDKDVEQTSRIDVLTIEDVCHVVYSHRVGLFHVFRPFKKPKSFPHTQDVEQYILEQTGIVTTITPPEGVLGNERKK